ncbi:CelD/BcsL family acetyltransferase involved in cellulose biosynthesis [Actinomycetospora succinea]|uniref:CelD/BcsL family acetyltransferase involved in cellulose biosynthesis n=1 Tax=Actinomycetospora succinea TaxID=663603 RepID=A0A4R6UNZ0_9PSEU|nr:GNAT family N-acetyltransferase [Actinomycetospora succinea]TDQ48888.1 CelD/BcsL family acetyltransferase involved in cellulose biosynthesis [Actinomycetospora succinea]
MDVDVVEPAEVGPAERERWATFQDGDNRLQSPFLSLEFTEAAARHRPEVRVAVVSEDGEVVGFLPFERGPFGEATGPAALVNEAHGVVHRPGWTWDTRRLLDLCGIGVFDYDQMPGRPAPFSQHTTCRGESPIMDLRDGFDAYLARARQRSSRIKDLPRRRRRLEREVGPVRFELAADDPDAVRTLIAWKSEQYRRTARRDRFATPWVRALAEDVATLRTRGCSGTVSLLWAGDTLVAGHLGLRSAQVLPTWFPTYDPGFSRYSPGLLLHLAMAEHAAAEGVDYIDLGRGPSDYKDWLADRSHEVWEGRAVVRTGAGVVHWARHVPMRELRNAVVAHPRVWGAMDRTLRTFASFRAAVRPGADPE